MAEATKRQAIGKRLRFRIFERDKFTCHYCGRCPPEVRLVIDHVMPVVEEGITDEENLVTACHDCNSGKGGKILASHAPVNEAQMSQEYLEQIDLAQRSLLAIKARTQMRQAWVNHLCAVTGRSSIISRLAATVCNLINEFDPADVVHWIDLAFANVGASEVEITTYLCRRAQWMRDVESDAFECDQCEEHATMLYCKHCGASSTVSDPDVGMAEITRVCDKCAEEFAAWFSGQGTENTRGANTEGRPVRIDRGNNESQPGTEEAD